MKPIEIEKAMKFETKWQIKKKKKHKTINVLSVLHDSLCFSYVDLNVFSSCFNFNRYHVLNALHLSFVLSNGGLGCRFAFNFLKRAHKFDGKLYFFNFSLGSKLHQIDFNDHETVTHQSKQNVIIVAKSGLVRFEF